MVYSRYATKLKARKLVWSNPPPKWPEGTVSHLILEQLKKHPGRWAEMPWTKFGSFRALRKLATQQKLKVESALRKQPNGSVKQWARVVK